MYSGAKPNIKNSKFNPMELWDPLWSPNTTKLPGPILWAIPPKSLRPEKIKRRIKNGKPQTG